MKLKVGQEDNSNFWKTLNEADELLRRDVVRMVSQLGDLLDQNLPFEEVDERMLNKHGPNFTAYWRYVSRQISRFHPQGQKFVAWKQSMNERSRSAA